MTPFDPLAFRKHFPLLANKVNQQPLVYFDNGATTQKPKAVIDRYQAFYKTSNANVHRASHALSAKATTAFEQSRVSVQQLIKATYVEEVIFTKGTTESINLVAQSYARPLLKPGDNIVLIITASKHRIHSIEANQFIIDYLKTEVPIWKNEEYSNHKEWVNEKKSDIISKKKW